MKVVKGRSVLYEKKKFLLIYQNREETYYAIFLRKDRPTGGLEKRPSPVVVRMTSPPLLQESISIE